MSPIEPAYSLCPPGSFSPDGFDPESPVSQLHLDLKKALDFTDADFDLGFFHRMGAPLLLGGVIAN